MNDAKTKQPQWKNIIDEAVSPVVQTNKLFQKNKTVNNCSQPISGIEDERDLLTNSKQRAREKIVKEGGAEPNELERCIAQALLDLGNEDHGLSVALRDFFFI